MSKQTKFDKATILGVEIDCLSPDESIQYIEGFLSQKRTTSIYIVKPYVEFMTKASHDKNIKNILNQAELCLADGVSLQWAASFLYGRPSTKPTIWKLIKSLFVYIQKPQWRQQIIKERGAGVDATSKLLQVAQKHDWSIGIMTGKDSNTASVKNNLKKIFPTLNLVRVWPGYFDDSLERVMIDDIKSYNLDILLVARGFPLQEKFICKYLETDLARVLIGEGGSFDYDQLGGRIKRAPQAMRKIGLEWLWRLFMQPKRIIRMLSVPYFVWLVYFSTKRQK